MERVGLGRARHPRVVVHREVEAQRLRVGHGEPCAAAPEQVGVVLGEPRQHGGDRAAARRRSPGDAGGRAGCARPRERRRAPRCRGARSSSAGPMPASMSSLGDSSVPAQRTTSRSASMTPAGRSRRPCSARRRSAARAPARRCSTSQPRVVRDRDRGTRWPPSRARRRGSSAASSRRRRASAPLWSSLNGDARLLRGGHERGEHRVGLVARHHPHRPADAVQRVGRAVEVLERAEDAAARRPSPSPAQPS